MKKLKKLKMIAGVVMVAMFGTIAKMSGASETALPAGAIRDSFRHRGMDREYILYSRYATLREPWTAGERPAGTSAIRFRKV